MSAISSESEPKPAFGARLAQLWARAGSAALDTLYPPVCLACRTATSEAGALCWRCWRAMRFIERPFCDRLGTPFEHDLGEGLLSPQAVTDPPAFQRARAVEPRSDQGAVEQLMRNGGGHALLMRRRGRSRQATISARLWG